MLGMQRAYAMKEYSKPAADGPLRGVTYSICQGTHDLLSCTRCESDVVVVVLAKTK